MLPIVVNSNTEQEYFTCFRNFPDTEWNAFVEFHFPQLIRKMQETVTAEVQTEQRPHTVNETLNETVHELDAKKKVQKEAPKSQQQTQQDSLLKPENTNEFDSKYAKYQNEVLNFAYGKQFNVVDIVAGIGLDNRDKTIHRGITRLCEHLIDKGLMKAVGEPRKRRYTAISIPGQDNK